MAVTLVSWNAIGVTVKVTSVVNWNVPNQNVTVTFYRNGTYLNFKYINSHEKAAGHATLTYADTWSEGDSLRVRVQTVLNQQYTTTQDLTLTLGSDPGQGGPPSAIPTAQGGHKHWRRELMYIGDPRRDAQFARLGAVQVAATTAVNVGQAPYVATDGMVYQTVGEMRISQTLVLAAGKSKGYGVYMAGPDEFSPDRIQYRLTGSVASAHNLSLMLAIGPAAPSNQAAGQQVVLPLPIEASVGGLMVIDEFIALAPFGTINDVAYSTRPLAVVVDARNFANSQVSALVEGHVCVQRAVGAPPRMIDRRIT